MTSGRGNRAANDIIKAAAEQLDRLRDAIAALVDGAPAPAPVYLPVPVRRPAPVRRPRW